MKNVSVVICMLILLITNGCRLGVDKKVDLPVFDFGVTIGKSVPDTFIWNNIAKRISYVPIEMTNDVLLALPKPVYIGEDVYYMVDYKTNIVFRMDKKGKILSHFSKKGQGPGEYAMITYVHINPQKSTIQLFDQRGNKYIIYDFEGNLQQEIFLKNREITTPLFISDNYTVSRGQNTAGHKLFITDGELNVREGLFPIDSTLTDMERLCLTWQLNYCRNRDEGLFHYADEDTVFAINEAGVRPICIFEKGVYKLPEAEAKVPQKMTDKGAPYILTMGVSSISNYYVVSYVLKNLHYYEIWDKVSNQLISRFSNKDGKWGIPFCLPNGDKVWIDTRNLYVDGNIIAFSIDASTASEGGVPGVGEDDNPILVIMEL